MALDQAPERAVREVVQVVGVRVDRWRDRDGPDEMRSGSQQPDQMLDEPVGVGKMLDRLDRNDRVEAVRILEFHRV